MCCVPSVPRCWCCNCSALPAAAQQPIASEFPLPATNVSEPEQPEQSTLAPVVTPEGVPEELPVPAIIAPPVVGETGHQIQSPAPLVDATLSPSVDLEVLGGPTVANEEVHLGTAVATETPKTPFNRQLHEFWGYRTSVQSIGWALGDGDQFGAFWLDPDPYLKSGVKSGVTFGLGIGFLAGPERTDMPPRVFDISIGYQHRERMGDFAYDVAAAVLASSDFEGSARDGIRFPAHAVGYWTLDRDVDLVFGVDFLDRDDLRLLPVAGVSLRPHPAVRIDLVFPRPRVELQVTPHDRIYMFGGLGGGSWAIERVTGLDEMASLYELELGIGLIPDGHEKGIWVPCELVYLFDRKLEYASGRGDYDIGPTVMLRTVSYY